MKESNVKETKSEETQTSRNGNSNRKARRDKSKRSKSGKFYEKTKGSNDLSWHTPDAELLHRTAMIPWSYQTGEMVRVNRPLITTPVAPDPIYASQAGFMVLRDAISVGGFGSYFTFRSQPTYTAANSLLTTMRSRTRVRNTYDAPDVLMLTLAMDNIYAAVAFLKRCAATVKMFAYQNHYMPREMLKAQGVDPDWMEKNQYQFVTELNVIISEINKIYIPSRMHLFELHNSRFSNYYTEGTSIKDQIYMFAPAFFSAIDYNPGADYQSMVKPILCFPGTATITDGKISGTAYNATALYEGSTLLMALRQMVTAVIEHDATADITGDMENAFGTSERFILANCDPDAIAAPIFDEEILETIHNASVLYGPRAIYQSFNSSMNYPYFSIVQDVNTNRIGMWDTFYIQKNTSIANILNAEASFTLLDVHHDPNPEKTFAITRLRSLPAQINSSDDNYIVQVEFGADLIVNCQFYNFGINASNVKVCNNYGMDSCNRYGTSGLLYVAMAPFHYAPLTKLLDTANYLQTAGAWYMGESDIYSEIPDLDTIKNMNRLSLLTLLGAYNNL